MKGREWEGVRSGQWKEGRREGGRRKGKGELSYSYEFVTAEKL